MCLLKPISVSELSSTAKNNLKNRVGYKVFRYVRYKGIKRLYSISYIANKKMLPKNRWIKDKTRKSIYFEATKYASRSRKYPAGFHIFLTKAGARHYKYGKNEVIQKIKFEDIQVIGIQDYLFYESPCVVARDMIIKEDIK